MPTFAELCNLPESIVKKAVEQVEAKAESPLAPFQYVDVRVLQRALVLADGAWGRLEILDSTTILVHNTRVW